MGRPRKPASVRRLAGNPGHRPIPDEIRLPAHDSGPPAHLEPIARAEWERITPILREMGVLTAADLATVESYCVALAGFRAAQGHIDVEGAVIKTKWGPALNPWLTVRRHAYAILERSGGRLGLSPVDRAKLSVAAKPKASENDEFFGESPKSTDAPRASA